MDIKEISKDVLFKKYKVVVSKEEVNSALESEAQEIAKTAQIPGFRSGKAPLNIIKSRYEADIRSKLVNKFVDSGVEKIVKDNQFELSERPTINSIDFKSNNELVWEVDFELLPQMPAIDFSKIQLTKYTAKTTDEAVEESLVNLQKRNQALNSMHKDIPVEKGHVVLIDVVGSMDGKEFPEGNVKDHKLELGSKQFIEGFEDGLIGCRTGEEKTLSLKFPANYHEQKYADKPVEFVVKIKETFKPELPKLDDEFAKKFNLKDLIELRETTKTNTQDHLNRLTKTLLKKDLFDNLNETLQIEVPPKLLKKELEFVTKTAKQDEASQAPKDVTPAKPKKTKSIKAVAEAADGQTESEKIARRRIKLGLFINDLAKKEKITLNQQDITDELMLQFKANPEMASFMMKHYKENPQALEPLRGKALEDKVVSFILSKVVAQEKNVTGEELKTLYDKTS